MIRHISLLVLVSIFLNACTFTYKIKSGEEAYEVKQYAVAAQMLEQEYQASSSEERRAYLAFLAGKSYDNMARPQEASRWYAMALDNGGGEQVAEHYALSLRKQQRYEEAITVYESLMVEFGQVAKYRGNIAQCRQAMVWLQDSQYSKYRVRPTALNSFGADYAPFIAGPNQLVFTSDRDSDRKGEVYNWTGRAFSNLYTADFDGYDVRLYEEGMNSQDNEGSIAVNSSRDMMIFTRCYSQTGGDAFCKLMSTVKENGRWSDPVELSFMADGINYGHPVFSLDGQLLFFSSDSPDGLGGYDIYLTRWNGADWETPGNLGPRVNTQGNEMFPTLHYDTLYFSSDYLPGMGGLDIFKSWIGNDGNWVPPLNLKPPVNSGGDDCSLVIDTFRVMPRSVQQQGFFCSSRPGGSGNDDIYAFSVEQPPVRPQDTVVPVVEQDINYQLFLALKVVEPVFAISDDPNSERIGKRPLARARINIGEGADMRTLRTDENGFLVMEIEYNKVYDLQARFRGFLSSSLRFDASTVKKDPNEPVKTVNREILLEPIFAGVEIVMENIYYDLDKWNIREDAKPALQNLAKVLLDNPGIRIQLGSHTDCRADDEYNMELSQKRAQSAVDFLISLGIDADRLEAVGYGETLFAVDCLCDECSEEQHQANRRTTFKVIQ